MDLTLPAYLFRASFDATRRSDQSNGIGSRTEGDVTVLSVPVMPVDGAENITISTAVIRSGVNPLACGRKDWIVWSDMLLAGQVIGCLVDAITPASPDWRGTGIGVAAGPVMAAYPTLHPVEIDPQASNADASLWYRDWSMSAETALPFPGEAIAMTAEYAQCGTLYWSEYWTTVALTCGRIVAKWDHPTLARAFVYDISVEGRTFYGVVPTDLLERTVGDMVGVVKETTISAAFYRPDGDRPARIDESSFTATSLRIAPVNYLA